MLSAVPAMLQHFLHRASRFFERVCQNRHTIKRTVVVYLLSQCLHCKRKPSGIEEDGLKGVSDDIMDKGFVAIRTPRQIEENTADVHFSLTGWINRTKSLN